MNFLYDYYSVSKCLLAADRSMRLCTPTPGGEKHKQALLPSYNDLVAKNKAYEDAVKNKYAGKEQSEVVRFVSRQHNH